MEVIERLPQGGQTWLEWKKARQVVGDTSAGLLSDIQVLEADGERYMGFICMISRRK